MATPIETARGEAPASQGESAVEVRKLVKRYGRFTAVDGISFAIRRGGIFGILGPNGAGKTTTLEILEGIRTADGGEAYVDGLDVRRQRRAVQQRIGVQLQATTLFAELTLRETLRLFGSFYQRALPADELLRQVALDEKANESARRTSPAASGSASPWPSRSSTTRGSSSSTSRPPDWTRRAATCSGRACCGCASRARPSR